GERLVREVLEGRASPFSQCARQDRTGLRAARRVSPPAFREEACEAIAVELVRLNPDEVPMPAGPESPVIRLAGPTHGHTQLGDVLLEHLGRGRRGILAPQRLDQTLA